MKPHGSFFTVNRFEKSTHLCPEDFLGFTVDTDAFSSHAMSHGATLMGVSSDDHEGVIRMVQKSC